MLGAESSLLCLGFLCYGKWRALLTAMQGLLVAVASLVAERRLQALRLPPLQQASSVVLFHKPSCFEACGIFPGKGSNLCPLCWQADSYPLYHLRSPDLLLLIPVYFSAASHPCDGKSDAFSLLWSVVDSHCCITVVFQVYSKVIEFYTHIYIILSQVIFHYGLLQHIEYSSLYYTVGACCLFFIQ